MARTRSRITLADVARECDVATSTVSRVLSNTYPENFNVRPEVRDRILATARKLHYVPHAAARQLQTSRSMSIGIIAFRMTDRSHAVIVERVEELLYNKGYLAWVGYVREQPDTFERYVREFASRQADGVLCLDRTITPKQRKLLAEMHPTSVFYIGEEADGEGLCTVDVNRRKATRLVLEHLADRGYRRVGMVLNRCSEPIDRLRQEVWRQVGATRGIEIDDSLVFECNLLDGPHGPVSAERAVERLVEGCGVDALFCGSERQAMYVLRSLYRRGLSVPDDVALAASGNEYHGDSLPVAITTVDNRYDRVAEALVKQLLEKIENDGRTGEPARVYTEPKLIVREST